MVGFVDAGTLFLFSPAYIVLGWVVFGILQWAYEAYRDYERHHPRPVRPGSSLDRASQIMAIHREAMKRGEFLDEAARQAADELFRAADRARRQAP